MAQLLIKNFDAANPNFWARILISGLGLLAVLGIKFPSNPEVLGTDLANSFTNGGLYAVLGIITISVLMPIYNFVRSKPKVNLVAFFGSPNTWIYLVTGAFALLMYFGISIPGGTAEALVGAIFTKDFGGAITIIALNVLDPIIRWLRDKKNLQKYPNATTISASSASSPYTDAKLRG